MLGIDTSELLLVALVALVVIGPKDLPKAMRVVGYWVGRARGVARQFRSGFDTMIREAELEEMEKKWAEENARIMREHPPSDRPEPDWAARAELPDPDAEVPAPGVEAEAPAPETVEKPEVVPAATPAPIDRDDSSKANS